MNKDQLQYQHFENVEEPSFFGQLVPEIVRCICNAFEENMPAERALRRLKGDLVLIVTNNETQKVVGFSSSIAHAHSLHGQQVRGWYLDAATVALDAQGQGIYKEMNRQRLQYAVDRNLPLIFTRTQNPKVEEGIKAVLEEFKQKGVIVNYTLEREKVAAVYGRMLTKVKPIGKYTEYTDLNHELGDAYLLLFSIQYPLVKLNE